MTGTEFTEMYKRDIAKLHNKGGGTRVSFGEKLFGNLQNRRSPRQKGSGSKSKALKEPFSILSSPARRPGHRRSESAPRSARHHVAGSAAGVSGAATERAAASSMMNGPGILLESYITHFDAKFRRRQIPQSLPEAEALYIQLLELKQRTADLEAENVGLRTVLRKREKEKTQVEKRVEELIANGTVLDNNALRSERAVAEGQLIQNLRGKIRILETNLAVTTEELNRLKLDGKYLRVRELETEVKAYYSEARRLQRILDQMTASRNKDSEKQAMDEALALLQDKEQVIVRLRDTIATLKQTLKQHRQELDRLQEEKERHRHEAERRTGSLGGDPVGPPKPAGPSGEELEALQAQLAAANQGVEERVQQVARLTEQLRAVKDDLQRLAKQHEALVTEHEQQLAHNRDLQEELKDLQQDLKEMTAKFQAAEERHTELHRQLRSGVSEADVCREECDRMKDEFKALSSERDALLKDCRQAQEDAEALQDQVRDLKADLAEEKTAQVRLQKCLTAARSEHEEEVLRLRDDHQAELDELRRAHTAAVGQLRKALAEEQRSLARSQREAEEYRQELRQQDEGSRGAPLVVAAALAAAGPRRLSRASDTSQSTDTAPPQPAAPDPPPTTATAATGPGPAEESDPGQGGTTSAEGERPAFSELDDDPTVSLHEDDQPAAPGQQAVDQSNRSEPPAERPPPAMDQRSLSSRSSTPPRARSRSSSPKADGEQRTPSPRPAKAEDGSPPQDDEDSYSEYED
eukprot:EG_transcript_2455